MTKLLLPLCFSLMLAACGESNPLLGTWRGTMDMDVGLQNTFEVLGINLERSLEIRFAEHEVVFVQVGQETRLPVRYRVEKDQVYITGKSGQGGEPENWQPVSMPDKDTLEFPVLPGITAILKRVR